jgi:hypothetical protein
MEGVLLCSDPFRQRHDIDVFCQRVASFARIHNAQFVQLPHHEYPAVNAGFSWCYFWGNLFSHSLASASLTNGRSAIMPFHCFSGVEVKLIS